MDAAADPVLSRFRQAVVAAYGDRLDRIVLFGSRARGDFRPDSDYDIAVFLRDLPDRMQARFQLADIGTDVLCEVGHVIHAVPFRTDAYDERSPLMGEIRREGIEV